MLKRVILPLLLSVALSPFSWSADFQKGSTAAQNGDFATALREWTLLAERVDVAAQFNLGVMYYNGYGVPQDYKTAMKWNILAAEKGHAAAQYLNLGPRDYESSVLTN